MKRCPCCGSEMLIVDTHYIEVVYKIVGGKRSKNPVIEKPSEINKVGSKVICQNQSCRYSEDTF